MSMKKVYYYVYEVIDTQSNKRMAMMSVTKDSDSYCPKMIAKEIYKESEQFSIRLKEISVDAPAYCDYTP